VVDVLADLPLGRILPPGSYGAAGPGVVLAQARREAATLAAGRDGAALRAAVSSAFAASLIDAPCVSAGQGVEFVGVGPGRWLALSERPGLNERLERAIGEAGSAFEQSGGLVVCQASGPALALWLAKLVPLGLDALPVGAAATTNVAHINVTLWRTAPGAICFALGLSFLAAFLRAAASAAAEYGFEWRG
jgi:sarcosine oxidase subunit gamma